jgi:hypothetical protein
LELRLCLLALLWLAKKRQHYVQWYDRHQLLSLLLLGRKDFHAAQRTNTMPLQEPLRNAIAMKSVLARGQKRDVFAQVEVIQAYHTRLSESFFRRDLRQTIYIILTNSGARHVIIKS